MKAMDKNRESRIKNPTTRTKPKRRRRFFVLERLVCRGPVGLGDRLAAGARVGDEVDVDNGGIHARSF
ncbi:hypothetical protein J19TS2_25630 [Cohnella xylanilytica]|nr:hypothetical protein J19TS2_25630 [Cohnella xylanilytica]